MHDLQLLLLILLLLVVGLATVARRFRVPYPIVLTVGGLLLGFVPGLPPLRLDPDIVFLVFLPPILYSAAVFTSFRHFRENLRPISLLAVGLVLTTTVAVAVVTHGLVEGLPWAAAFAFGAIVSPPDAIAATAITRHLGLPQRIVNVLEGESLVNDATALVAFRMALAALLTGAFSLSDAVVRFVAVVLGGIAIGLAVGWLAAQVRRRVDDPPAQITLSLLTPFAAYLPAEAAGVSSVLAVVTTGLYIGAARLLLSPSTRLQALAVWEVVVFLLNGFIFVLIGLQLPAIMGALSGSTSLPQLLGYAVLVSLTVILVRLAWVFPATYLPRLLSRRLRERDPYPGWRPIFVVGYTGLRGVVSLAAAFALPLRLPGGEPFPARDLLLFLTFAVIVATLLLQGISLPAVIRALGLVDPEAVRRQERHARLEAARAAIGRLEQLASENGDRGDHLERLRWRYEHRSRRLALDSDVPADEICRQFSGEYESLRRELLKAERDVVRRLHEEGEISDDVMLLIDRELDLEESRVET
ncbi:MAG: Na+/H+ antiporter [Gemmatimonadetes bacterium]|nr:Na+/H+ antiporter [Gemmatimonadota bacterium]